MENIEMVHISVSGEIYKEECTRIPNEKELFKPGKVVLMNGPKEASPDLLHFGRTLVEMNRRQDITPSDIAILKAYGITPSLDEDISGLCERLWDWAKENL